MTEEHSWESLLASTSRAAAEAAIIIDAFHEHGIEIGGETDPAHQDGDVEPHGIAFMFAKDHILTREQYLRREGEGEEAEEEIGGPQSEQSARRPRGVLDILRDEGILYPDVTRLVGDIVLIRLSGHGKSHESNDTTPEGEKPGGNEGPSGGNDRTSEDDRGTVEGEQHDVLHLLDLIDRELGVGIATPDHVLTAAQQLAPCSATEPTPVAPTAGPYPAACRHGGDRVRIFVADTGLLHEATETFRWLRGVRGKDDPRTHWGGTIDPYGGHGTFVAGILRCMAPEAEVRVANVFNIAGSALESCLVRRLNKAFDFGFEIPHLTASCMTRKNLPLLALGAWLDQLRAYKGVVCVAPAGNFHTRRPSWPGAFPGVISVGALATDWHHRADFSDYGGWVDVYAPGQNLINAFGKGTYTYAVPPNAGQTMFSGLAQWSGTSFSAPIVTGLIAARMARCDESAKEAVDALLAEARAQRISGVGPVLLPGCDDDHDRCCCGGHGRCGGYRGRCGDCGGCGGCGRCGDDGCGCGHRDRGRCDRGHCGCVPYGPGRCGSGDGRDLLRAVTSRLTTLMTNVTR